MIDCEYKKGLKSGLECGCEDCAKIRGLLFGKEIDGKAHIVADEKDKGKWRN